MQPNLTSKLALLDLLVGPHDLNRVPPNLNFSMLLQKRNNYFFFNLFNFFLASVLMESIIVFVCLFVFFVLHLIKYLCKC